MSADSTSGRKMTLADKCTRARHLIDAHALYQFFSKGALQELSELTNTELLEAFKARNPSFPNDKRHLHVLIADWTEPAQWSWRKAIEIAHARNPEEARKTRLLQKQLRALRQSIQSDMDEFRQCAGPRKCAICSSPEHLSTDHVAPPFSRIARDFLKTNGDMELVEIQGMSDGIKDPDVEAEWIAYHARFAVYQLLCRSCNSSKGAR